MDATFLTENIWQTLTAAAKKRITSAVAVAYFGQGAAKLLPLSAGSSLVVDASDAIVKSGQTCPSELKKLLRRGVRIYTRANLHAKVLVFGPKAFIGSTNASHHSARRLREAVIATTNRRIVAAAKKFIYGLCVQELGAETLARLEKIYRPPRFPGGGGKAKGRTARSSQADDLPRVRLAQLRMIEPPPESESADEAGRRTATKRMEKPRRHSLEEFWWSGERSSFLPGEMVVQVLNEGDGRVVVSPPGTVVHTRKWRRGTRKLTFIYVEVPKRRRMTLDRLAKRMGRGSKKRLSREGQLSRDFAQRLLMAWQRN
jgi:hypothetical protein